MKKWAMAGGLVALMAGLSGCATLSVEECQVANWYDIGYRDGVAGKSWSELAAHSKACAKAHIVPDQGAWEQGRKAGLKQYCTTDNAYRIGLSGRAFATSQCPASQFKSLDDANAMGRAINNLEDKMKTIEKEVKALREEYEKLKNGENLKYATEKEARARLANLPSIINDKIAEYNEAERRLTYLRNNAYYY